MTTTPSRPVMELSAPDGWPAPPDPAAYHGLAGAIVERLAPNTEADPVAILTQLLVACGAMLGHQAFFQVEATTHHPNEFVLARRRHRESEKGQLVRSRRPPAHRRAPQLPLTRHDRPVERRGSDLGRPRPPGAGPRRARQTTARRRARIRVRPESHIPRDLDALADTHARRGTAGRSRC